MYTAVFVIIPTCGRYLCSSVFSTHRLNQVLTARIIPYYSSHTCEQFSAALNVVARGPRAENRVSLRRVYL